MVGYRQENDYELRAKKALYIKKIAQNKPYNYIQKNDNLYRHSIHQKKIFQNDKSFSPKFSTKPISKNQYKRNTEVVVKITSCSRDYKAICRHIDYISRNGNLELLVSDIDMSDFENQYFIKGKEGDKIKFVKEFYKDENKKKIDMRETYNMIFSMKDYTGDDSHFGFNPNLVRVAAFKTIKTLYPNNHFTLALHDDTNNPHCHICLKIKDKNEKRLDIKKKDLVILRKTFASELVKVGIEATATSKKERIENEKDITLSKYEFIPDFMEEQLKNQNPRLMAYEKKCFEILDFGVANYLFEPGGKESYFVKYLTKDYKPVTIWGKGLEKVVENNNVQKGSFAKFKKIGTDYIDNFEILSIDNKLVEMNNPYKIAIWDCITFDKDNGLSKQRFDEKPIRKNINLTLKELNGKYTREQWGKHKSKQKSKQRYTREQWAEYYRNKKREVSQRDTLCIQNSIADSRTISSKCADNLRTMPQSYVDISRPSNGTRGKRTSISNSKLLLHNNAQLDISNRKATSIDTLRRTNSSDRRTTRNNGEIDR